MPSTSPLGSESVDDGLLKCPELSVVMPCLNEEDTLSACIDQIRESLQQNRIAGEIIVADNGSKDKSAEIAQNKGARLVLVVAKGYGHALMGGINAARGKYIIMGDADGTYDFTQIPVFLEKLRNGYELVMGNRFKGGIEPGAMPALHRYFGNPMLTGIGRLFFKTPCRDFHCGLRGFSKTAYERMQLRTTGMEFASEMVVKASLFQMPICEVPTTLSLSGRGRRSHLRSWYDGWRHLRFLLLYSPRWLFLYPGMALMLVGSLLGLWLLPAQRTVGSVTFDVHTMVYAAAFVLLGFQAIAFAVFTKFFAISEGLLPPDRTLDKLFQYITLEVGIAVGTLLTVAGLATAVYAVSTWGSQHFGPLDYAHTMRLVIPSALFLTLGAQTIFASFFMSVLGLRRR